MTPADRAALAELRWELEPEPTAYGDALAALDRLLASHHRAMRAVAEMQAMAASRYSAARRFRDVHRCLGFGPQEQLFLCAFYQLEAAALSLCVRRALGIEEP